MPSPLIVRRRRRRSHPEVTFWRLGFISMGGGSRRQLLIPHSVLFCLELLRFFKFFKTRFFLFVGAGNCMRTEAWRPICVISPPSPPFSKMDFSWLGSDCRCCIIFTFGGIGKCCFSFFLFLLLYGCSPPARKTPANGSLASSSR